MAEPVKKNLADDPWPDRPSIREFEIADDELDSDFEREFDAPIEEPDQDDFDRQCDFMVRRQRNLRWAAQRIAAELSGLDEITRVEAFGSVAAPLDWEVPRFREYRRFRIQVPHECRNVNLAVWSTGVSRLREWKDAINRALKPMMQSPFGGVPAFYVDLFVLDHASGAYRGRLCEFNTCPKQGKWQCRARNCGASAFLRQFDDFRFSESKFQARKRVELFNRASGFVVSGRAVDDEMRWWKAERAGEEEEKRGD